MKYRIKKGSSKMIVFMLTGIFLIIMFGYQLYDYIQMSEFIYEFPGDWDKPIGISVGVFLIIRSLKFVSESKGLFINISGRNLSYRTIQSHSICRIALSDIQKTQKKGDKVVLITKDLTELIIIDFNKVRVRDNVRKSIEKSLIELNGLT